MSIAVQDVNVGDKVVVQLDPQHHWQIPNNPNRQFLLQSFEAEVVVGEEGDGVIAVVPTDAPDYWIAFSDTTDNPENFGEIVARVE